MQIAPATLRASFEALNAAHSYIARPASITPCVSKRVATHRLPNRDYALLDREVRAALKTLSEILTADPPPA